MLCESHQQTQIALEVLAKSKNWTLKRIDLNRRLTKPDWDPFRDSRDNVIRFCPIIIHDELDQSFWERLTEIIAQTFQCNLSKRELKDMDVDFKGKTFITTPTLMTIAKGHPALTLELLRFHDDDWACSQCGQDISFDVPSRTKQCLHCKAKQCQPCYLKATQHKVIEMDVMWPLVLFYKEIQASQRLWQIKCPSCQHYLLFSGKDVHRQFHASKYAE